jgi:hypothetical protein
MDTPERPESPAPETSEPTPPTSPGVRPVPTTTRRIITDEPPETTWPKTLGIVCIVIGILGMLGNGLAVAFTILTGPMMDFFAKQVAQSDPGQAAQMREVDFSLQSGGLFGQISAVASLLWALILVVSGVMLIRRSRNARFYCMTWASVKILLLGAGLAVGLLVTQPGWIAHLEELAPTNDFAAMQLRQAQGAIGPALGFIMTAVFASLPLFVLLWCMRGRIRSEMRSW